MTTYYDSINETSKFLVYFKIPRSFCWRYYVIKKECYEGINERNSIIMLLITDER